jgi:tRNA modification GTPase
MYTSSRTGEGLTELRAAIARHLSDRGPAAGTAVTATAVRCRQSLERAAQHLVSARRVVAQRGGDELVAVELRDALDQLGQVVGAVYTEDFLTRIFGRFCIGK